MMLLNQGASRRGPRRHPGAARLGAGNAGVTHNHPEGIRGAQAVARSTYRAQRKDIFHHVTERHGNGLSRPRPQIREGYRYGPLGTDGTALIRHVAESVPREWHTPWPSGLDAAFVGETEQNIVSAFAAPAARGTVPVIAEMDTFLQNRAGPHAVGGSRINGFLAVLEACRGSCICPTLPSAPRDASRCLIGAVN